MALKPCRECGKQVSTEAATCPKCGVSSPAQYAGALAECRKCGKGIGSREKQCPHCGRKDPTQVSNVGCAIQSILIVAVVLLIVRYCGGPFSGGP